MPVRLGTLSSHYTSAGRSVLCQWCKRLTAVAPSRTFCVVVVCLHSVSVCSIAPPLDRKHLRGVSVCVCWSWRPALEKSGEDWVNCRTLWHTHTKIARLLASWFDYPVETQEGCNISFSLSAGAVTGIHVWSSLYVRKLTRGRRVEMG